jgi:hypothetical protein
MSGTRTAEPAAEPAQETAATPQPAEGSPIGPAVVVRGRALRADTLSRLPSDEARRDYVRALGAAYGNRDVARLIARAQRRTLARLIDAAAVEKIAKNAAGKPMEAHHLVWELIHLFAPEKGFSLSGSRYEAGQVGFGLDGNTIVVGDDVVGRVAKGDTAAVGKDLLTAMSGLPDPFGQIAGGGVSVKSAPENIGIPRAVQEGSEAAWSKSLPGTKSQEQGGIIVQTAAGGYGFTPGQAGTSGTFTPNRSAVKKKKGEKLLGILHTHPYSAKEGGHTDVPFSGQDLAIMALQLDKISVVRSGDGWFVVATSKEFEERVKKAKSKRKLFDQIKKSWTDKFNAFPGNTKESAVFATPAVCLEFQLLYYTGHGGQLSMPPDMVKAYKATP